MGLKKYKRTAAGILISAVFVVQFCFVKFGDFAYANKQAQDKNGGNYYYAQLTQTAKDIYDAMCVMYENGSFKTGTKGYDLAENGYVTQDQLISYSKGSNVLTSAMNAARYAFFADHPEIFYVDFSRIALRVTKDRQGRYHAVVGAGSHENYYVDGFTDAEQVENAVAEFNAKVDEIAGKAALVEAGEGEDLKVEQIRVVHNEIIYNTSYRLEGDCTPGYEGFINTPYGALVKKQAICEGYARAFKTILDKIGIKCILVQGLHQSEDSAAIEHMWNYVEIENKSKAKSSDTIWYAVDTTFDDPFMRKIKASPDAFTEPGSDLVEGFENSRYCMVGTETTGKEHVPLETVAAAGYYQFRYPEISSEDYGINTVTDSNGLLVKFKQEGTQTVEYTAGDFYISYNGKGYIQAAEEGKYILMKSHYYRPGDQIWTESLWTYFLPDVYAGAFEDYGDHIYLSIPNSEYMEFAVTTLPPGDYKNDPIYLGYHGDESDFVARSEKLYNPNGKYKGRPYIKEQSPAPTASLSVGPTYHVRVVYDDDLIMEEGAEKVWYDIYSTGSTGEAKSTITNFNFDGKRKIEFDISFSRMFADDGAMYRISITGVVGKNSGKTPNYISYGAVNRIMCSYRMNKARNWEVFARPMLLENEDLSMSDWQMSDGKPVSDVLKNRIALVTTRTTREETDAMNGLMAEELKGQEIVTSETYDISLNVCRKYVVKTGHRLRLSLGFPAGYGPDDAGVTFKAYHFIRNDKNEVTGVEEIPCVVTPYGLVVTCDSFSPYAVAVVRDDGSSADAKRYAVASAGEGGVILGADRENGNLFALSENEQRTVTVRAEQGYEIETITVCGRLFDMSRVKDKSSVDIDVKYSDIKDGNGMINAVFVATSVAEEEQRSGHTIVVQKPVPAEVTMPQEELTAFIGQKVTLTPLITGEGSVRTYQWFKDGKVLEGQTDKTLSIVPVSSEDGGSYTLKVTTLAGALTEQTVSEACRIDVKPMIEVLPDAGYVVDGQERVISRIAPGTTAAQFRSNISAAADIVFTDKDGNVTADDSVLGTGMILKAGADSWYTLSVTGDVNGDGETDIDDLAGIKLHLVDIAKLEGAEQKAADIDNDGEISIIDAAQIKLAIIDLLEIK